MGRELRIRQSDMQSDSQTFRQSFVGPCAGLVRDLQKYRDPELFLWVSAGPFSGIYNNPATETSSDCLPFTSDCLPFQI